jgi:LytR cell envelope-related transcriptional attenuator
MSDQSRRSRPLGASAAPRAASPAIAVVIALLAAVVGFFILKKLDNNDGNINVSAGTEESAAPTGEETQGTGDVPAEGDPGALPVETTPPTIAVVAGSYQVVVANGSGVNKAAGSMSAILGNTGMKMGAPTNILETLPKLEITEILFEPGFEAQGAFTAKYMGCGFVAKAMPTPKPVDEAAMVGSQVLIVLGKDLATTPLKPCTDAAAAGAAAAPTVDPAAVTSTTAAA